jgi:plastocyanin
VKRALVLALVLVLASVWGPGTASAVIARPAVVTTTAPSYYAPLMVVMPQGMSLLHVQLDPTQRHDVVSRAARDRRPLFASARTLSFGEAEFVHGVSQLPPGAYPFTCSIHPFMFGQVIVR